MLEILPQQQHMTITMKKSSSSVITSFLKGYFMFNLEKSIIIIAL